MKILHVVQAYHPAIGGSEWLTRKLSEHLVADHGDAVTVLTTNVYKPEAFWKTRGPLMRPGVETINGVTVRRFRVFNGLRLVRKLLAHGSYRLRLPYNDWLRTIQTGPLIARMPQAIADSDADVVLATAFPFLHMYYALSGARRGGTPVALLGSLHLADPWSYDRKMIYRAIQRADAYVALTTVERDHLIDRGISPDRISVIGCGVEARTFAGIDGTPARQRYDLGNDPVVGVLARQSPLKRLDILLQAMVRVWASGRGARLVMAGAQTSYSAVLDEMVDRLPPEQKARVTVIRDFAEEEKPEILAAYDVYAHPSGNESFGICFVEAWACARPVVGARVGVIPSVIDEGRDGLLFEYLDPDSMAQAIIELLDHPSRRREMGQAGQRKVFHEYTWETVTERLRAVYLRLTGQ